jgi:hypothetical protein
MLFLVTLLNPPSREEKFSSLLEEGPREVILFNFTSPSFHSSLSPLKGRGFLPSFEGGHRGMNVVF